mmetsp:Transcript_10799/g.18927  ORF Transcript_10799/g.18927 Transcript_10799/m.18927 type:complete len:133 (-) Transcript_10799:780-1178(-)|eukprot:CAMPEP_0183715572 /NCGR_PEP_ID=MMETSP0737-20130205/9730_1 /TAXON_ID=385413 /ORGANISM="Thalassiosira miniscula, Strain CCMP1093" /LENGTH=132 /DNA_ID=CAMNT_0025944675 /DNA_START=133 /DNA_END=531 /DNA_ORIENTATION=-
MSFHTAHPLSSRIRSAATNVADLTPATVEYAKCVRDVVRAQRAADAVQEPVSIRFQHSSASASTKEYSDDESVDSNASFSKHLDSGSKRLFGTEQLRPNQHAAVERIVIDPSSGGKLLLAERTGGGKSLMFI